MADVLDVTVPANSKLVTFTVAGLSVGTAQLTATLVTSYLSGLSRYLKTSSKSVLSLL